MSKAGIIQVIIIITPFDQIWVIANWFPFYTGTRMPSVGGRGHVIRVFGRFSVDGDQFFLDKNAVVGTGS